MTDPTPTRDEAVLRDVLAQTERRENGLRANMDEVATLAHQMIAIIRRGALRPGPQTGWLEPASAPAPASGRVDADEVKRIRDWLLERNRDHLAAMHERTHIMSRKDGDAEMFLDAAILLCHLASLPPAATPGLAMPSREWMRDKIAADPDVEDCGAVPAATPVSEAGGEITAEKLDAACASYWDGVWNDRDCWTEEERDRERERMRRAFDAAPAKPASSPAGGDVEEREVAAQAALARIKKLRDQYANQAKFADVDEARLFRQFVERLDRAALSQSTSAGRVGE